MSNCFNCKHYNKKSVFLCAAFPKPNRTIARLELGIPGDIFRGEFDHTKKHPDQDNDILFEPIEENK